VSPDKYQLTVQTLYFDKHVQSISIQEGKESEFNISLKLPACPDPVKRLSDEEKGRSRICAVHQERLRSGIVRIVYGLVVANKSGADGEFPNSNRVYYGGCVAFCYERAEVLFCQRCRRAELKWEKNNIK
jgi:hypothetical protein